jgi:uncharacterized membrane protein
MTLLVVALLSFVGTHFLLSHPLRAPMLRALGFNGFAILYSLIAIGTFGWTVLAFQGAPRTEPLWEPADGLWLLATLLMLVGSVLFAGSIVGNPALPRPDANVLAQAPVRGVFAITRHPMMWGFALWAFVHALVAPNQATLILTGGIAFLALAGSVGQDRKKAIVMGESWRDWRARTSFVPFSAQMFGKLPWGTVWPGRTVVLAGIAIWLVATWLHPALGGPVAGIWRWWGSY